MTFSSRSPKQKGQEGSNQEFSLKPHFLPLPAASRSGLVGAVWQAGTAGTRLMGQLLLDWLAPWGLHGKVSGLSLVSPAACEAVRDLLGGCHLLRGQMGWPRIWRPPGVSGETALG